LTCHLGEERPRFKELFKGTATRELTFSPDTRYLAAGGLIENEHIPFCGRIGLFDIQNRKEVIFIDKHKGESISAIAFLGVSPNGKFLVAGGENLLIVWEVSSGNKVFMKKPAEGRFVVWAVRFAKDGRLFALAELSGRDGGSIEISSIDLVQGVT